MWNYGHEALVQHHHVVGFWFVRIVIAIVHPVRFEHGAERPVEYLPLTGSFEQSRAGAGVHVLARDIPVTARECTGPAVLGGAAGDLMTGTGGKRCAVNRDAVQAAVPVGDCPRPSVVGQHRLENAGVGIVDVFEAREKKQCLSFIVRRRGRHDVGVVDGAETLLVLSIQPLISGVGAVADACGLGIPSGA
jgi:hypothetical protein